MDGKFSFPVEGKNLPGGGKQRPNTCFTKETSIVQLQLASTFSAFSKCFGNVFFCIFCKPHTYSHPFLPTLVSYKKIWPIYGFVHFSVTKKRAKLGSNLKQLIKENFRFPSSNCDFFLLTTSHTEDMRQKNPN